MTSSYLLDWVSLTSDSYTGLVQKEHYITAAVSHTPQLNTSGWTVPPGNLNENPLLPVLGRGGLFSLVDSYSCSSGAGRLHVGAGAYSVELE